MFLNVAAEKARVRINSSRSNFITVRNCSYIDYLNLQNYTLNLYPDSTRLSDFASSFLMEYKVFVLNFASKSPNLYSIASTVQILS